MQKVWYAGFMADMIRELYKKAYTKEEQKESGSYDTPLHLARRIWKNIPVEYLAPQNRIVADMTCGWGSFLMAGPGGPSRLEDMEGKGFRYQFYSTYSMAFFSLFSRVSPLNFH